MKNIHFATLVFLLVTTAVFAQKSTHKFVDTYYQFYTDGSGTPYFFAGASEDFLLTGCKFGPVICGKVYTEADVEETSPGSGVYVVIAGHENNEIAAFNKFEE
jgi:hypothetical protein